MKKYIHSLIIRMPEPLRARLQLAQQRHAQRCWDRSFHSPASEEAAFRACRTPDDLFAFARNRFEIDQNRNEFLGLLSLLASRVPVTACEIGTRRAGSLFMFCHGLPTLQRIAAIDLIFQQRAAFTTLQRPDQDICFIEGNSRAPSTLKAFRNFLRGLPVDFLFIDGDHSYNGCKLDFEIYRSFVRPGGLIIFHDIVMDITTRTQSAKPLSKAIAGGVPILWKELRQAFTHYEFVDDWQQDGRGIGVIQLPNHE